MADSNILFVGMDVHKESIEIAIADGANQEVRRYGKIGGTQDAMRKTLRKLVSLGNALHFCYDMIFVIKVKAPGTRLICAGWQMKCDAPRQHNKLYSRST